MYLLLYLFSIIHSERPVSVPSYSALVHTLTSFQATKGRDYPRGHGGCLQRTFKIVGAYYHHMPTPTVVMHLYIYIAFTLHVWAVSTRRMKYSERLLCEGS
jgi:hypothetical protein